jgi:hypothetical protein
MYRSARSLARSPSASWPRIANRSRMSTFVTEFCGKRWYQFCHPLRGVRLAPGVERSRWSFPCNS